MFLHVSVSHSVHRGVCHIAGPEAGTLPQGPGIPPGSRHPPGADHPSPNQTPPLPTVHAGGTHPTGMQSCFLQQNVFNFIIKKIDCSSVIMIFTFH